MSAELDKPKMCECGKFPEQPSHTCPYKEEIGGSSEECECCDECTYQCAMDI